MASFPTTNRRCGEPRTLVRAELGDPATLSSPASPRAPEHADRYGLAFTLVEMVIVVAIIILLAGLVLPAASQMWRERKLADAQNMVSGMLMVARAEALEGNAGDSGLFFYVDGQDVQRVVAITQNPNPPDEVPPPPTADKEAVDEYNDRQTWRSNSKWRDVFTVSKDRSYALPAPMRVVPRYAVCENQQTGPTCPGYVSNYQFFSEEELANNDFLAPPTDTDIAQRHRNFFSMVYSPDGELRVQRDVLIRDMDADCKENPEAGGDITGLRVGAVGCLADVTLYYNRTTNQPEPLAAPGVGWLVTDSGDKAIVFPSVDGLLVYDESLFREAGDAKDKRKFLMESGQPFYIQRLTGAVVRGPVGEAPTP